jgi:hypothetical protein
VRCGKAKLCVPFTGRGGESNEWVACADCRFCKLEVRRLQELKAERNKRGGERIGQHRRFSGVEAVQEASRRPKPCGAVAATEGGGGFDFLKKMNEGRVGLAFRARAATGKFEKTEETSWASGPDGLNSTTEQENRFSN